MAMSLVVLWHATPPCDAQVLKTETFDTDPGWDGRNNRATDPPPRQITQNFGYSPASSNAGGPAGEMGGLITPAGEAAYFAKVLPNLTWDDPLSVSGKLRVNNEGHTLLGFFNSNTINEWRTPNALAIRLYGRSSFFYAYPEYGTAKWRANATSFPGSGDEYHFAAGSTVHTFTLNYDPAGNGGNGLVTVSIDGQTGMIPLTPGHRADGATFNRFGFLNVMKAADTGGPMWIDSLVINGVPENFSATPLDWVGLNNRRTYMSNIVRPRFDFGYTTTNRAGGAGPGEIGGQTWRGDSRAEFGGNYMAYYGDRLAQTLDLNQPLHASGKVAFHRGVSDSTTLIGFFHSTESVRIGTSDYATPENFLGAAIEGPSSEGFFWYPTYGTDVEDGHGASTSDPYIYPNGESHFWALDYDPTANGGRGRITLTLDGHATTLDLTASHRAIGARFDRFGIITTHVDGLGQDVFFDDLTYTYAIPEPASRASAVVLAALLIPGARRHRRRRAAATEQLAV
jgi:hypothetical protein